MENFVEEVKGKFVETYQRIEKLQSLLTHTPGCIVYKGPAKQYAYWQVRQNGHQIQHYIQKKNVPLIQNKIAEMKRLKALLRSLRDFLRGLKITLRAFRVKWQSALAEFEKRQAERKTQKAGRQAAKNAAGKKAHAEHYQYQTDKGDHVASKSELIIANALYAENVEYEYEKPLQLGDWTVKPDFTVKRADGSIVIWEHAGLLDQERYAQSFQQKMNRYMRAGYVQTDNLIVTTEQKFSTLAVRQMIEQYDLI